MPQIQGRTSNWATRVRVIGFILALLILVAGAIFWLSTSLSSQPAMFTTIFGALATIFAFVQLIPILFPQKPSDPIPFSQSATLMPSININNVLQSTQPIPNSSFPNAPSSVLPTAALSSSEMGMHPGALWTVPYPRNLWFTGREELLARLAILLRPDQGAALSQPFAISGLGGIGKTQIAVEYAFRNQTAYEHILWINADSFETMMSHFVNLTHLSQLSEQQENDPQYVIQAVKDWLNNHTGWLLIFDNVNDLSIIYEFFPLGEKGHILFTTNSPITGTVAQCLEIEQMDEEEGALFLLRRAKRIDLQAPLASTSNTDQQLALEIAHEMDGLPLALDQAGAYIEETGCSLADYLLLFRTKQAELLKRRGKLSTNHLQAVTTTLSLSFEQVRLANPTAIDILRVFAFLDSDTIPEDILIKGSSAFNTVFRKAVNDSLLLNEAIGILLTYSLVHRNYDRTFTVHRLVQAVLKHSMSKRTQHLWTKRVIRAIYLAFPGQDYTNWQDCQQYIPHIRVCTEIVAQWKLTFPVAANLLMVAGNYLVKSAQYEQAETFYQRAMTIREKSVLRSLHPGTATTLHFLAHLYQDQGKFEQAETYHQRELAIREKIFGPEHQFTAQSLYCMAKLYREQGKFEQAETFYQRALAIREKTLGLEHPKTIWTISKYASLLRKMQRIKEAMVFEKRVRATRNKITDSKEN